MSCYQIINLEQGTAEWLAFRKDHIGASEAPIIMGASPWKTKRELWENKLGLTEDQKSNRAMQRGIDLEPAARAKFIEVASTEVSPAVAVSTRYPFMMASYDGISADGKTIVEIKCPGKADHEAALKGRIPKKYLYQLIQQMIVAGVNKINYFSYRNDDDFSLVNLELDPKMAEKLIEEEKKFWEYVTGFKDPDEEEGSKQQSEDLLMEDDPEWKYISDEYKKCRKEAEEIEAKLAVIEETEKAYRGRLIALSGDKNAKGNGIRLTRIERKGTIDYTLIPELNSIDLDKYRKSASVYWKIMEDKAE